VPSGQLTLLVLDNSGIIGYNRAVRLDKALRACRVRYARKSSFAFVRSSCLWFLPPTEVKKSRSAKARAGRQMGRWADRCRGIGHPLPTASDGPQAGRWRRHPSVSNPELNRIQNRGNKARMYMKTKDKHKKSGSADRRFCGLRLFHDRLDGPRTASTAVRATPESREQSENVYENKQSRS
jgi:hypothetical protein